MTLNLFKASTSALLNRASFTRCFSISICKHGLEEFFPPGVYSEGKHVEENPIVGRKWKASELRIRSNTDLHKFWYVLLKERNMLLTMRQECKRLGIPVPGPTRYHKVRLSMDLVKQVIHEREAAILELQKEKRYNFDDNKLDSENILQEENVDYKNTDTANQLEAEDRNVENVAKS